MPGSRRGSAWVILIPCGVDDELSKVQAARRQLAQRGAHVVRYEGDFERVSLPAPEGDVLRDLVLAERANTVIEIGLGYGVSALAIAEALVSQRSAGARHIILDAYQGQLHGVGWDAIVAAGLTEICSLMPVRSQLALPQLVDEELLADVAFVDGSHIFHNVFVDLFFLRELIRPGGLVILDDCSWLSVATATRYFEINTRWQRKPISQETRLRAYRLPDPRVEPNFEEFQPFGLNIDS